MSRAERIVRSSTNEYRPVVRSFAVGKYTRTVEVELTTSKIARESIVVGNGANNTNIMKPQEYRLFRITTNTFARKPIVKREYVARSDNRASLVELQVVPRSLPYGHTVEFVIE